ncbi:MAG TPA: hypothetical protein PLD95_04190 [bacterium]|jgi:hypothetical protein|nr:hypothetical protein [bacterium]HOG38637.1 hypothetical protein [bacterium]HQI03447.1 hypothetical protein [bacterium]
MCVYFLLGSSGDNTDEQRKLVEYVPSEHLGLASGFIYFKLKNDDFAMIVSSNFTHEELLEIIIGMMSIKGIVACGTICNKKVTDWYSRGLKCLIRTPKVLRWPIRQILGCC